MDTARYWIALLVVAGAPGMFVYWFSMHPFIRFWRKLDPRLTVALHFGLILALAMLVVLLRERILAVDFGTQPVLAISGATLLIWAAVLKIHINRQLSNRTLTGLPELDPERYGRKLVTEGLYARVRHPRYAQIFVALLGYALFCNYLATWVACLLTLPWVHLLARLEEKELVVRFGEEYERYRERVPRRFVPLLFERRG